MKRDQDFLTGGECRVCGRYAVELDGRDACVEGGGRGCSKWSYNVRRLLQYSRAIARETTYTNEVFLIKQMVGLTPTGRAG